MIVAIHAAVGGGTGLDLFQKGFPDRCFDVGIAGQHTVTFAAGLAAEGVKPFCATCSSFLQRGFDQVRFAMVVMAPSCKAELMHTVATAAAIDDQPSCFMYLRGNGIGAVLPPNNKGTPLERCVAASELLEVLGIPRFCEQLFGNLIHDQERTGKWRAVMLPDRYIGHGSQTGQVIEAGLGSHHIAATVLSFYRQIRGAPLPVHRII
ncbi:hypothetical protein NL676_036414 [Syzygium grande]|nr:hypothetical protein NL676_036414 [Syzygium grande]